jgi:hypothetical protein
LLLGAHSALGEEMNDGLAVSVLNGGVSAVL